MIPYPIAVELKDMVGGKSDKEKASRQRLAKMHMTKEDKKQQIERGKAKSRVGEIEALLTQPENKEIDIPELEEEKRALENSLAMFEIDDD